MEAMGLMNTQKIFGRPNNTPLRLKPNKRSRMVKTMT